MEESELSQEDAKKLIAKYKSISKEVETFRPSFEEVAKSELIGILNVCIPIKKFLTFNLLKLTKRAIQEGDLPLLKVLVENI